MAWTKQAEMEVERRGQMQNLLEDKVVRTSSQNGCRRCGEGKSHHRSTKGSLSAGLQAEHCRRPQQSECHGRGKPLDLNGRSGFESGLSDSIGPGLTGQTLG